MSVVDEDELETLSVLSYLEKEGSCRVNEYFLCNNMSKVGFPNYSDMIKKLNLIGGTTREGIKFESTKIHRGDVTTYLKERYKDYVSEKTS